jgi:hypothetical protein
LPGKKVNAAIPNAEICMFFNHSTAKLKARFNKKFLIENSFFRYKQALFSIGLG